MKYACLTLTSLYLFLLKLTSLYPTIFMRSVLSYSQRGSMHQFLIVMVQEKPTFFSVKVKNVLNMVHLFFMMSITLKAYIYNKTFQSIHLQVISFTL